MNNSDHIYNQMIENPPACRKLIECLVSASRIKFEVPVSMLTDLEAVDMFKDLWKALDENKTSFKFKFKQENLQ